MSFRKALPEDNDDIVDYFIAEELLRRGEQHTMLIVTEVENQTAGFVWLNDDVVVKLLIENYEIDAFHNLIKYDPKKQTHRDVVEDCAIEKKPVDLIFKHDILLEVFEKDYLGKYLKQINLSCLA